MNSESITENGARSPAMTGALIGAAVGLLLFVPFLSIPEIASLGPFEERMYQLLSVLSFPYPAVVGGLAADLYGVGDSSMPGLYLLIGACAVAQFALYGWIIARVSPHGLGVAVVGVLHLLGILLLA